jgi:hypothetical protein
MDVFTACPEVNRGQPAHRWSWRFVRSVLAQRPFHMLAHDGRCMLTTRFERCHDEGRLRCIPQRHCDVAQPALVAAATDRAAFGAAQEFVFLPREQARSAWPGRGRCGRGNPVRRCASRTCSTGTPAGSRRSRRCGCRSAAAGLRRDAAFVFDGEVADAAPRVQPVRRDDRLGRADLDAARAAAAVRAGRRIDRQRQVDVDSPRKNQLPPSLSIRQVCLPIQPSPALRASARSSTGAESTNTRCPNGPISFATRREPLQAVAHQLVVIAAQRVAGHVGAFAVAQVVPGRVCVLAVIQPTDTTRSVPGISSAGRLRLSPWLAIHAIEPCRPSASQ